MDDLLLGLCVGLIAGIFIGIGILKVIEEYRNFHP